VIGFENGATRRVYFQIGLMLLRKETSGWGSMLRRRINKFYEKEQLLDSTGGTGGQVTSLNDVSCAAFILRAFGWLP